MGNNPKREMEGSLKNGNAVKKQSGPFIFAQVVWKHGAAGTQGMVFHSGSSPISFNMWSWEEKFSRA